LTYVNLGIGTNVSSFNISLVNQFNQTGNGTFCLKETGKANLAAGLAKAGLNATSAEGLEATLQIIQISTTGAALYNVSTPLWARGYGELFRFRDNMKKDLCILEAVMSG
jgi:hypothetical protein